MDGVCDGVVLQQRVDCFASVLSVLSHLCVFMQLSLRSVWRCTWMAIAAPLATCGGYGRMAGGGRGVGGMRKACCLCQVEVMFQQRMRNRVSRPAAMSVCAGLCMVASALVPCSCCHACEPGVMLYEQQVVIAVVWRVTACATGFCPSAGGRPPMIFCYRPRYRPPGR